MGEPHKPDARLRKLLAQYVRWDRAKVQALQQRPREITVAGLRVVVTDPEAADDGDSGAD